MNITRIYRVPKSIEDKYKNIKNHLHLNQSFLLLQSTISQKRTNISQPPENPFAAPRFRDRYEINSINIVAWESHRAGGTSSLLLARDDENRLLTGDSQPCLLKIISDIDNSAISLLRQEGCRVTGLPSRSLGNIDWTLKSSTVGIRERRKKKKKKERRWERRKISSLVFVVRAASGNWFDNSNWVITGG